MTMNSANDIVVFLEPPGERRDDINRGLVTEGARIARLTGGRVIALTVGSPAVDGESIEGHGADRLIHVYGDGLAGYGGEAFARAAARVLETTSFMLVIFAHTDRGKELAPRVAALLGTAAVTDCIDIRFREGRLLHVRQPYGGQLEQEIHYGTAVRQVVTMRTDGLYKRQESRPSAPLERLAMTVAVPADIRAAGLIDTLPADYRTVDILYARRIVGLGAGAGESRELVEELAHLLGASIAATRPVVDDGLAPKTRMVGQTGRAVAPDLYMALGISGSPHHVAGIQDAGRILSVNLDPRAPISGFSDAAFVGDLRSLLPKLIKRVKRHRNGESS
jgi:electron transfer flavoprotein alpha subunit